MTRLLVLAGALSLLLSLSGLQPAPGPQWLEAHHCIATGNRLERDIVTTTTIDGTGALMPVATSTTQWEYLCDDRDESHWLEIKPNT